MDILKENIVKFIDALIVEDYSNAHKFLEVVINEKVKAKIAKAAGVGLYESKSSRSAVVKGADKSSKKSAFGGEFPKAKTQNTKVVKKPKRNKKSKGGGVIGESHSSEINLMDEIDQIKGHYEEKGAAKSALFDLAKYRGGERTLLYKVTTTNKVELDYLDGLIEEVYKAIKMAQEQGESEDEYHFQHLLKVLEIISNKYFPQEENI